MYTKIFTTCSSILTLIYYMQYVIIKKKGSEKMKTENQKKYDLKYRAEHCQVSISVTKEVKQMIDQAAERTGKSKAQYITDLIKADKK